MAGLDESDDMFPSDLPAIPRMRKPLVGDANPKQDRVSTKCRERSSIEDSDDEPDDVSRSETIKQFALAPPTRQSRGKPKLAAKSTPSSSRDNFGSDDESDRKKDNSDVRGCSGVGATRLAPAGRGRGRKAPEVSSDSNSEDGDEADDDDDDDGVNGDDAMEARSSYGAAPSLRRRKKIRETSGGSSGSSGESGVDADQSRSHASDDENAEGIDEGRRSSRAGDSSGDSDTNESGSDDDRNRDEKLRHLELGKSSEKPIDDYSEDESLGSEEELPGKRGDPSARLTNRQRAMQGENLGAELTKLASPRHKKKKKPPSEDLTKDEEKAMKMQQKAHLRHMVHEKRNKEKRAAMVDKVLRGVTSKRKKLSLAAETYVAEAGARLAKNSARDDCYRYTSNKQGGFVSIPTALEAPPLLIASQSLGVYPPRCERDPRTGKRMLPSRECS
jgi:PAPA-1-like conserved region